MKAPPVWEYLTLPEAERERLNALGSEGWELVAVGDGEQGRTLYLKREVLAHLNWTASTYKRAYARLVMLADACDPWVRESIFYALKN